MSDLPEVAIPSYGRQDILLTHTLPFLLENDYPPEKITIFVASEQECEAYQAKLPRSSYGRIVVGVLGLLNQRKFIHRYYPEGQTILHICDDVKGLKSLRSDQNFLSLVNYGVSLLKSKKAGLFGVLPNDDSRKMEDRLTTHLSHIIGSFYIEVNDKDCIPDFEEVEDYERCILHFKKYGMVLRWRGAGVKHMYNKTPGGMKCDDRPQKKERDCKLLLERYPEYIKLTAKHGMADVTLNWRARHPHGSHHTDSQSQPGSDTHP